MKLHYSIGVMLIFSLYSCESKVEQKSQEEPVENQVYSLTEAEKAAGWELLFDGKTTTGWHSYLEDGVSGWKVVDGALRTEGGNADLVSDEAYENFELELEWKIDEKGNSGIIYLVDEKEENKATYVSGPEYQIIDDENYPSPLNETQISGANYALHPPLISASKAPGEFNHARISVLKGEVEHWLNGKKVVAYSLWTPEWEAIVDTTKFGKVPTYGRTKKGKIAFQDHGDGVSFRNIRIRKRD